MSWFQDKALALPVYIELEKLLKDVANRDISREDAVRDLTNIEMSAYNIKDKMTTPDSLSGLFKMIPLLKVILSS